MVIVMGALWLGEDGSPGFSVGVCYAGDLAAGEDALRPLRESLPLAEDGIRPMAFCAL